MDGWNMKRPCILRHLYSASTQLPNLSSWKQLMYITCSSRHAPSRRQTPFDLRNELNGVRLQNCMYEGSAAAEPPCDPAMMEAFLPHTCNPTPCGARQPLPHQWLVHMPALPQLMSPLNCRPHACALVYPFRFEAGNVLRRESKGARIPPR